MCSTADSKPPETGRQLGIEWYSRQQKGPVLFVGAWELGTGATLVGPTGSIQKLICQKLTSGRQRAVESDKNLNKSPAVAEIAVGDHLATIDMGRKIRGCAPFRGGVTGSSSNTMSPEPSPTTIPSGILIHPAVWPQRTRAEYWGAVPILGKRSWVPV